jgi:hypothetical protein
MVKKRKKHQHKGRTKDRKKVIKNKYKKEKRGDKKISNFWRSQTPKQAPIIQSHMEHVTMFDELVAYFLPVRASSALPIVSMIILWFA